MADIPTYHAQLLAEIHAVAPLEAAMSQELIARLKIREVRKKDFLLQPGQTARHMNFIAAGCLRSYYVDEKGQEHTLQLGIENWWINDLYSYLRQTPSRMFIQAVEHSTLLQFRRPDIEQLCAESVALANFFRIKIQSAYVALQERVIEKMSSGAHERYQSFINSYRHIEQRIPQYMVASYLGVTPEFLSYLRNIHARKIS